LKLISELKLEAEKALDCQQEISLDPRDILRLTSLLQKSKETLLDIAQPQSASEEWMNSAENLKDFWKHIAEERRRKARFILDRELFDS